MPTAGKQTPLSIATATPARLAAVLVSAALLFRFFDPLSRILLVAYAAAILAVALNSVVRRIPLQRNWATLLVGLLVVAALGAALWFGGALLVRQLRDLLQNLPAIHAEVQAWAQQFRGQTGINVSLLLRRAGEWLAGAAGGRSVLLGARGVVEAVGLALVILFGALFALARPNERLLVPLMQTIPPRAHPRVRRALDLLGERLVGWVQGQLLAMLAVGVLATVAFYIIGVPYALLLGVLNGLTEFIPLVGPWLGGIPAVVVAAVDDPNKGAWTAAAVTAIQALENALILPLAMANRAKLHPFVTLFALLLFGSLFGFLGVLLAVPLVLLFWTLIQVFWVERKVRLNEDEIAPVVEE